MMDNLTLINRLMIQACLAPSEGELEDFAREWEKCVVMDDLDYSSMRLVPLFLYKINQFGITTKYDNRLKIIYKHWWLKTQHIFHQLKKVCDAMINAGIQPVIIKGASLITYYERSELRPMSDFDLLIKPSEINEALKILRQMDYVPDKVVEAMLRKNLTLVTDFKHSIECIHTFSDTKIDLHWRIGGLCSSEFTDQVWLYLDTYEAIPGARKPQLAYEAFIIIINAVESGGRDNLNWIIDINLLHLESEVWDEIRRIAIAEKKEDLLDYGYYILIKNGIDAPKPIKITGHKICMYYSLKDEKMPIVKSLTVGLNDFFRYLKYLFPYSSYPGKFYQGLRLIRLFLIYRKYKWLHKPQS